MFKIKNLPAKYAKLWQKCVPLLKQGRPDDLNHAKETAEFILQYKGKLKFDQEILIPMAMMHDIGHSAILAEHFKYITGPDKLTNGKLAHMLIGAKIAQELLIKTKYNLKKRREIVEMISTHDFDQIQGVDLKKIYNTNHKRIFHDIDVLDRFNPKRVKEFIKMYPDKQKLQKLFSGQIDIFFYPEFKRIAQGKISEVEKLLHTQ